jgi:hypothetical protein
MMLQSGAGFTSRTTLPPVKINDETEPGIMEGPERRT